jgi:arsenate reductase-like glutaredoxin family protein
MSPIRTVGHGTASADELVAILRGASVDQIVDVIVNNKMIMQRPLLVADDKAIIGRPKERVREFLAERT